MQATFIRAGALGLALVALGAPAQAQSWCTPGAHLNVLWQGGWYPATAKGPAPGGQCKIGYDGYGANWDEAVGPDRAAPMESRTSFAAGGAAATSPGGTSARGGGGAVKAGPYHCVMFVGPLMGGHLVDGAPFTVGAGGATYVDRNGVRGRLSLGADGTVEFHGGNYDRQAAKYEPSSGGRATLRIYNERRSRTVIDCEGPAN